MSTNKTITQDKWDKITDLLEEVITPENMEAEYFEIIEEFMSNLDSAHMKKLMDLSTEIHKEMVELNIR